VALFWEKGNDVETEILIHRYLLDTFRESDGQMGHDGQRPPTAHISNSSNEPHLHSLVFVQNTLLGSNAKM
jgi:hypothetical protein